MYAQLEKPKVNKSRTITQRNKCPKQSFGIVNRRYGSSALGGVRNRMNQKVGAGLDISTVVQRQIGPNGDVGQEVMYNGKKNWTIVNKELVDGKQRYTISKKFFDDVALAEDSPAGELVQVEMTPEMEGRKEYIISQTHENIEADITEWPGGRTLVEMEGTGLNGDNESTVEKPTLWSAGAADCVIVACVTKENKIQMAHCTRTGIQPARPIIVKGKDTAVYLASSAFGSPSRGSDNELITQILKTCDDVGVHPIIFDSERFAMTASKSEQGEIFLNHASKFDNP